MSGAFSQLYHSATGQYTTDLSRTPSGPVSVSRNFGVESDSTGRGPRGYGLESPRMVSGRSGISIESSQPPSLQTPQLARYLEMREKEVFDLSQSVADQQSKKVSELMSQIEKLETDRAQLAIEHTEEVRVYVEENERLRLQLDALNAEIAALSESQVRRITGMGYLTIVYLPNHCLLLSFCWTHSSF